MMGELSNYCDVNWIKTTYLDTLSVHCKLVNTKDNKKYLDKYSLLWKLGEGGCGRVNLVTSSTTRQLFGMKITKSNKQGAEMAKREYEIMQHFSHPCLIRLYEVIIEENDIVLIEEYCPGGSVLLNIL